ncbi:MAG: DegT/DnrJ/EryC1/StrS family aminotransferase [bacterium]|nr:DegT/DnrJ/EryC1/StrS family aminotransferase [bacterium]
MKVPFNDLKREYRSIKDEIDPVIKEVIDNTAFIKGRFLQEFEEAFAAYSGTKYAVGASSGTTAIHLALLGLGLEPGDEVITVANTFIGTTEPITHSGCTIKLMDVDPVYYNMDTSLIEEAITPKTKAIIPVHLYGQMVDMEKVCQTASKHNLAVIEDSAQAIGAEYKGKRPGNYGDAACFSFYPGKNLGAYGDGGIVITNNEEAAKRMRLLSDHGRETKYSSDMEGYNYRLDAIQAAILNVKLRHIDKWNDARREAALFYHDNLHGLDIVLPEEHPDCRHVYHVYCVQVNDREKFQSDLKDKDVPTGIHYPEPIHTQKAYDRLGLGKGSFPVTEDIADKIVSLPVFPFMKEEELQHIVDSIKSVLS